MVAPTSHPQVRYVEGGPCPGTTRDECAPTDVALSRPALDALAAHVGGRDRVVRRGALACAWGDIAATTGIASTRKPTISTLLLGAVQEEAGRPGSVHTTATRLLTWAAAA
jgi:hypothetical protein